jgi:hypothetical protein
MNMRMTIGDQIVIGMKLGSTLSLLFGALSGTSIQAVVAGYAVTMSLVRIIEFIRSIKHEVH